MLEVWLDGDLGPARQVGTLAQDRGQIRFRYEREWLKDGPDLDEAPRIAAADRELTRVAFSALEDSRGFA